MNEVIAGFAEHIQHSAAAKTPLRFMGSGSKNFYGGPLSGEIFDTRAYTGIVDYDPTELVITARCGTTLNQIEAVLLAQAQMLAFEPPHFGDHATIGGTIATGLSGPRRAATGSARDFVLGIKLMNGRGEVMNFGGRVMKNVAGFDVSRLMVGSLGTLGLLLEVSLKILPLPAAEATLRFEVPQSKALDLINRWAGQSLPISATCWEAIKDGEILTLRLSGANAAVAAARRLLGGEIVNDASIFWCELREQRAAFFVTELPLWRLSLPSIARSPNLHGAQLIEWGGGLRWLKSDASAERIRDVVIGSGGHATLFRSGDEMRDAVAFQEQPPVLMALQRKLKQVFDPDGIFNPGRMYQEF